MGITFVNVFFAIALDLYADEAYYVLYAEHLDWGYLDHPPAVGFFVYLGQLLFKGELGVRVAFILLSSASYFLIYDWIRPQKPLTLWLCLLALLPMQLMGFMALPDVPLLFFSILFFRFFHSYLKKDTIFHVFLLALAIAGMLYSKYHGALLILFSFFSVPQLFARRSFYGLTAVSILLYTPHLLWMYEHEFSGLQYHFFDRSAKDYSVSYTLEYVFSFLLFNGPLVFGLFLWFGLRKPKAESFDRVLKVNLVGVFLFFLLSSFKGRVEANWTLVALIPAIYLTFTRVSLPIRLFTSVALVSLVGLALFRVHLIHPLFHIPHDRSMEFHGHQAWADSLMVLAGEKPLIATRYQEASLLSFYSGKKITAINMEGRKNQFDFWDWSDSLENRSVLKLNRGIGPNGTPDVVHPYYGAYFLSEIPTLTIIRYPEIECIEAKAIGDTLMIRFRITAQNILTTKAPIWLWIQPSVKESIQGTVIRLSIDAINQGEVQEYRIFMPALQQKRIIKMYLLSDGGLVWKTKSVKID